MKTCILHMRKLHTQKESADQLLGSRAAVQHICFCYIDSTIPLLPKFIRNSKPLAIFCIYTALFVLDLVGNPEDRFSRDVAQIQSLHGTVLLTM